MDAQPHILLVVTSNRAWKAVEIKKTFSVHNLKLDTVSASYRDCLRFHTALQVRIFYRGHRFFEFVVCPFLALTRSEEAELGGLR